MSQSWFLEPRLSGEGEARVCLVGEFNYRHDTGRLAGQLKEIYRAPQPRMILDCKQASSIDGQGVISILVAYQELLSMPRPCRLILINVPARFRDGFQSKSAGKVGPEIHYSQEEPEHGQAREGEARSAAAAASGPAGDHQGHLSDRPAC